MYTLNFANGQSQTYPNQSAMIQAAQKMGGTAQVVDSANKIYVFVPKK